MPHQTRDGAHKLSGGPTWPPGPALGRDHRAVDQDLPAPDAVRFAALDRLGEARRPDRAFGAQLLGEVERPAVDGEEELGLALARGRRHAGHSSSGCWVTSGWPSEVARNIRRTPYSRPPTYAARCFPVSVFLRLTSSAGVPSKTTVPPSCPAPGPRSMIQSACAMTAWWCSMTITDRPASTRPSSRPSNCSTS